MLNNCEECDKEFTPTVAQIKRGAGRFCHIKCWYTWKAKHLTGKLASNWKGGGETKACTYCGKAVTRKVSDMPKKFFCSHACAVKGKAFAHIGVDHPRWVGGRANWKMISRRCKSCGRKFKAFPSQVAAGNGIFCSHGCTGTWVAKHTHKSRTGIERILDAELHKRAINHIDQHPIVNARTVVDFFVAPDICVYADGDYWHRRPGVPERDARKTTKLIGLGYRVLRFWEKDINNDVVACVNSVSHLLSEGGTPWKK